MQHTQTIIPRRLTPEEAAHPASIARAKAWKHYQNALTIWIRLSNEVERGWEGNNQKHSAHQCRRHLNVRHAEQIRFEKCEEYRERHRRAYDAEMKAFDAPNPLPY